MNNINHEAALEYAQANNTLDQWPVIRNLSGAYLDLDAQLEAERQRVDRLAELVESCAELTKLSRPKVSQAITEALTAIMEGRDNG